MSGKKRFFASHAKSSAALVSLAIHAIIVVMAISFVAVTVIQKDEKKFEAKQVKRPHMKLKKLKVPVNVKKKKVKAPKLRKNIVAPPKFKAVTFTIPETSGIKGGMADIGASSGLGSLGFGMNLDLFGGDKGYGNELKGTFYDLKMQNTGKPSDLKVMPDKKGEATQNQKYVEVLKYFASSWNPSRLEKRYFKAPKSKFATTFMVPYMGANEAPKAYGVEDVVQPKRWVAFYEGKIAAPETGRYRFWGIADDVLMVRIKKRLVIDANYPSSELLDRKNENVSRVTGWKSEDPNSRKFKSGKEQGYVIGDWFKMKKGEAMDMEVLIGEMPGGYFYCRLLIEQEGVEYPKGNDGRPILPVFKLVDIPDELVSKMKIDPGEATVDGPNFGMAQ